MSANAIAYAELQRTVRQPLQRTVALGQDAETAPAVARLLALVNCLVPALGRQGRAEVASASTDLEAALAALLSPEAIAALRELDPLLPARLRGLRDRERLLGAYGGAIGAGEAAARLGVSRQAVYQRRAKGTLLGLSTGRRGYLYPTWQFGADGMLPGLARVLAAIGSTDPWAKLAFMVNPSDRLEGESPVALLRRQGEASLERVLEAAAAYGEHGAA